jgi:hypothetical protein
MPEARKSWISSQILPEPIASMSTTSPVLQVNMIFVCIFLPGTPSFAVIMLRSIAYCRFSERREYPSPSEEVYLYIMNPWKNTKKIHGGVLHRSTTVTVGFPAKFQPRSFRRFRGFGSRIGMN